MYLGLLELTWIKPHGLQALPASIRMLWKWLTLTNPLAYYSTVCIRFCDIGRSSVWRWSIEWKVFEVKQEKFFFEILWNFGSGNKMVSEYLNFQTSFSSWNKVTKRWLISWSVLHSSTLKVVKYPWSEASERCSTRVGFCGGVSSH